MIKPKPRSRCRPSENAQIIAVEIPENISILGIAVDYETTLSVLATLNPQLRFRGCDFSNPSGGPDCNVLVVGQNINVPAPTPTITLSPTPSGSETPTPASHESPSLVFPPQNGSAPAAHSNFSGSVLVSFSRTKSLFCRSQI
ncbi:MAG: hypothetical protein U0670_13670 [Anaerolineae bacterium]